MVRRRFESWGILMSRTDVAYYRRRAREERDLAAKADNPHAARAHIELAKNYEGLVAHQEMLPARRSSR